MSSYPIKKSGKIDAGKQLTLEFRPPLPGVITVVARVEATSPTQKSAQDRDAPRDQAKRLGQPQDLEEYESIDLKVRVELFAPGATAPVSAKNASDLSRSRDRRKPAKQLVTWIDHTFSDEKRLLDQDWTVRIINQSDMPITVQMSAHFPRMQGNLGKIDHIVVLMMENRSFDHMLGYLTVEGGRRDVEGLSGNESNLLDPKTDSGPIFRVHPRDTTIFWDDPCHEPEGVARQLAFDPEKNAYTMAGFVANFSERLEELKAQGKMVKEQVGDIMGYHTADQVKTYDYFAREHLICDHWFASLPGPTWPNRFYAMAGTSGGLSGSPNTSVDSLPEQFSMTTIFQHLELRGVPWTYFYSDFPFLLLFKQFAQSGGLNRRIRDLHGQSPKDGGFYTLARQGELPAVSWIDPNFSDIPGKSLGCDDHPPANVADGQAFVAGIYEALRKGPLWSRTLFIVTYDEHGGFYDHVPPRATGVPDDQPVDDAHGIFHSHGVRVPAFVVSPWVQPGSVSKVEYDHTSILKTILMRFCADGGSIPDMGARVRSAADLWPLLSARSPHLENASAMPKAMLSSSEQKADSYEKSSNELVGSLRRILFGF